MEFKKCSRCGNFYVSNGNVCPKCSTKDNFEFSKFKSYIEENGLNDSIDVISNKIGVSAKNLNRFLEYNNGTNLKNETGAEKLDNVQNNKSNENDGITFLI